MRIHLDFDDPELKGSGVLTFAAHGDDTRQVNGLVWPAGNGYRAQVRGGAGHGEHGDRLKAIEAAVSDAGLPVGLRGGAGGVH